MQLRIGAEVEHKVYGIGRVKALCNDPERVMVHFKKEPPKPYEGYIFNVNPYVVPVETLTLAHGKNGKGIFTIFD
jgi:hypothetical protein